MIKVNGYSEAHRGQRTSILFQLSLSLFYVSSFSVSTLAFASTNSDHNSTATGQSAATVRKRSLQHKNSGRITKFCTALPTCCVKALLKTAKGISEVTEVPLFRSENESALAKDLSHCQFFLFFVLHQKDTACVNILK